MKRVSGLLLVLAMCSAAWGSLVEIRPIPEGEPGSASNPLWPSDTAVVLVYTDTTLVALNCRLSLTGPGTIVAALDTSTAAAYGWDPGITYDPVIPPAGGLTVEIGASNLNGNPGPAVGFYLIHCDDYGDVTATLTAATGYGGSMDITYGTPVFTGTITIYQVPEPMTIGLLGLGGLALLRRRKG